MPCARNVVEPWYMRFTTGKGKVQLYTNRAANPVLIKRDTRRLPRRLPWPPGELPWWPAPGHNVVERALARRPPIYGLHTRRTPQPKGLILPPVMRHGVTDCVGRMYVSALVHHLPVPYTVMPRVMPPGHAPPPSGSVVSWVVEPLVPSQHKVKQSKPLTSGHPYRNAHV